MSASKKGASQDIANKRAAIRKRGVVAMQNKFAEVKPRNFNPMSTPVLSDEARKAVNAAFDAMSTWRMEAAKNSEKNSEQLIEKIAEAARALGWPEEISYCVSETNSE